MKKEHWLLFLIFSFAILRIPEFQTKAQVISGWFFPGFNYRVEVNVTGSSEGNVTDYCLNIVIVNGTGVNTGNTYYTSNVAQSDFDDVRFTWYV